MWFIWLGQNPVHPVQHWPQMSLRSFPAVSEGDHFPNCTVCPVMKKVLFHSNGLCLNWLIASFGWLVLQAGLVWLGDKSAKALVEWWRSIFTVARASFNLIGLRRAMDETHLYLILVSNWYRKWIITGIKKLYLPVAFILNLTIASSRSVLPAQIGSSPF